MNVLDGIVNDLKHDSNTLSIVLIGSGSRGELDRYSDLDLMAIVEATRPPDQMFYRDDRLVFVNFLDRANREAMFTDPWYALKNMAAVRTARILFDPKGWYADYQHRANVFSWSDVAVSADAALSWVFTENVEMVHKILGGLSKNDDEKTLYATVELVHALTNVSALANGVLSNSENRFWRAVSESEHDSEWKALYWIALGFKSESVQARAEAVLRLYQRTALLYRNKLLLQHQSMVERVCALIASRGQKV